MRVAVIDLGTNTFNLVIADTGPDGNFSIIYHEKLPVRLGEGGINQGFITEQAFQRGLDAIQKYSGLIQAHQTDRVFAIGTSALRNASNGTAFIDKVKIEIGIQIEMISGDREAEYIYLGVRQAVQLAETPSLIMDIGGGSTEFIIADRNRIRWKQSFEIGAARLLDRFKPSDPLSESEYKSIINYLSEALSPLFVAAKTENCNELIGASGSFESLAEMIMHRFHDPDQLIGVSSYAFDLKEVDVVHQSLLHSTHDQRIAMKGLIPMRVDMIVVSTLLVEVVLQHVPISKMQLSTFALKEGVLWDVLRK